jgi:hypothetical protein
MVNKTFLGVVAGTPVLESFNRFDAWMLVFFKNILQLERVEM